MIRKSIINIITLILILVFAVSIFTSTVSIAKTKGVVNTPTIRVRAEANTSSDILAILYTTDEVTVFKEVNGWYKIRTGDGKDGYMKKEFIDVSGEVPKEDEESEDDKDKDDKKDEKGEDKKEETSTKKPEEKDDKNNENAPKTESKDEKGDIINSEIELKEDAHLKTYPLMYAKEIKDLKKGSKFTALDKKGNWISISSEGRTGWILKSYIK